jgi:hypothetical protein
MRFSRLLFCIILFTFVFAPLCVLTGIEGNKTFKHSVLFLHNGDSKENKRNYTLVRHEDVSKNIVKYSMWVDSVICRNSKCDVVSVQLIWDPLGNYLSFKVKESSKLTKLNHEEFSDKDLEKLQEILLDKTSALAEVNFKDVTKQVEPSNAKKLDGVSSATVMSLRNDVVLGAAYTCYDLWHLANGSITHGIINISINNVNESQLKLFLNSTKENENIFAVKKMSIQKEINKNTQEQIVKILKRGSDKTIEVIINYYLNLKLTREGSKKYLLEMFSMINDRQKTAYLKFLLNAELKLEKSFYHGLCKFLPNVNTFYETQLLLKTFEAAKIEDKIIIPYMVKLLAHKKFFIQRRAFKYLKGKKLSEVEIKKVNEFYEKHKMRL